MIGVQNFTLKLFLEFSGLKKRGHKVLNPLFFDTIKVEPILNMFEIQDRAAQKKINLRYFDDDTIGIALDETVGTNDIQDLFYIFGVKETVNEVCVP